MKRLLQIAKEQNIAASTLIEYCEKLGFNRNRNSKIDSELEGKIIDLHGGKIEVPKKNNDDDIFKVTSTGDLPSDFNTINPFEKEQFEIITAGSKFTDRLNRTITFKESDVLTIFSDFEAYTICKGLDNRHAKHIARNFFRTNNNIDKDQFEAHQIAMAALAKYGEKTLMFMMSLPPLPFKAINATQIFSELDKRSKKQEFPILRITFKNSKNLTEKIQISYYAEKLKHGRMRNDNVLSIKNTSTGQLLMRVSRSGIVLPESNAKQIVPVLQVFIRFANDTKAAILNYGLETGECSVCGRELTDSESIKLGIGPVCRQYI